MYYRLIPIVHLDPSRSMFLPSVLLFIYCFPSPYILIPTSTNFIRSRRCTNSPISFFHFFQITSSAPPSPYLPPTNDGGLTTLYLSLLWILRTLVVAIHHIAQQGVFILLLALDRHIHRRSTFCDRREGLQRRDLPCLTLLNFECWRLGGDDRWERLDG